MPDPLSQCVSHMPDFVCQESLQLDIQRSFFSHCVLWICTFSRRTATALPLGNTLALTTDVQAVTSRLLSDILLLRMPLMSNRALEQIVRAAKSFCLVPLRRPLRTPIKPFIIEARRLRTVARKVGKSHVPAPWVAQRTRKSSSYGVPARHSGQSVSVGHQFYVFALWPSRDFMFARMPTLLRTNVFSCFHRCPV